MRPNLLLALGHCVRPSSSSPSSSRALPVRGTTAAFPCQFLPSDRAALVIGHTGRILRPSCGRYAGDLIASRARIPAEMLASHAYETAGLQILELAQTAYSSYVAKNPHEQARSIKTLVSNSTFDRGSLSPTYVKPFDVFAKGSETPRGVADWLASSVENLLQSVVSAARPSRSHAGPNRGRATSGTCSCGEQRPKAGAEHSAGKGASNQTDFTQSLRTSPPRAPQSIFPHASLT
jgi:hypothetical protein